MPDQDDPHCDWIGPEPRRGTALLLAYRLCFHETSARTIELCLTADERFELFHGGRPVGEGPHRSDREHWCYHSFTLDCRPGSNVLVVRTWSAPQHLRATAQFSVEPAFAAWAPGSPADRFNTGRAPWEVAEVDGVEFIDSGVASATGPRVRIDGRSFPWGVEAGADHLRWGKPRSIARATRSVFHRSGEHHGRWTLTPTSLPPMRRERAPAPTVRHGETMSRDDTANPPVRAAANDCALVAGWEALLRDNTPLQLPARQRTRVLLDAGDYRCAFAQLTASHGLATEIRVRWAESLFVEADPAPRWPFGAPKGHRDSIEGKYFHGVGNEYVLGGETVARTFGPLSWEAGRYVEVEVMTADESATLHGFELVETRYPLDLPGEYASSDPVHDQVVRLGTRALQMCSHETHMDCPYYEQLQYVGDTRLQALTAYVLGHDSRLQRRAIELFDHSRLPDGLTQSRYPSRTSQVIPPFSLLWIGMVHDYWLYRGDETFVGSMLAGTRSVLAAHLRHLGADGLPGPIPGWAYVDWVPTWPGGMPPGAKGDSSSILCLQMVLALQQASAIERSLGIGELADLYTNKARQLFVRTMEVMWDVSQNRLADDRSQVSASEHAQALALLTDLADAPRTGSMLDALLHHDDLTRATVYFSHYVFEALTASGRADAWLTRLGLWQEMADLGLHTTIETPEPARSDCHAWGAHPIYHFHADVLGVRPGAPGFATVHIRPQLGRLAFARGKTAHPNGWIVTDFVRCDGRIDASIELPDQTTGWLFTATGKRALLPGRQHVRIGQQPCECEARP